MKSLAIALIVGHFLLDWMLQSRRMARKKSSNLPTLAVHLGINFLGLLLITVLFSEEPLGKLLYLNTANIITHGIIDWNIWPLSHQVMNRYPRRRDYLFYCTIAIDQTLHLIILMALFL